MDKNIPSRSIYLDELRIESCKGKSVSKGIFDIAYSYTKERRDGSKVYRSTRYVFIHCLWLKIEFYVYLKPWIIDPTISNANLETLAKLDTF